MVWFFGVVACVTVFPLAAVVPDYAEAAELYTIIGRPNVFSYNDLRSATEILICGNLLDEERYGSVYKVRLHSERTCS
jgi:hypothetical protein